MGWFLVAKKRSKPEKWKSGKLASRLSESSIFKGLGMLLETKIKDKSGSETERISEWIFIDFYLHFGLTFSIFLSEIHIKIDAKIDTKIDLTKR